MTSLANTSTPPAPSLSPERALLTPLWIAALAVLIANDHWLKGSGLLPEVLTGKLSDFAGLLVAPVLLATVLRIRSRRGLAACHVAVAAVFAGIQFSSSFAGQWSGAMGLLGHPWAITSDPSDLIALPFLLLSWMVLTPEMEARRAILLPLQRTAVAGLSVLGLWSTVATSDIDAGVDPGDVWYEDVFGRVFVNNANDFEISLFIRPLRSELGLQCSEVASDPGRLLPDEAFGEAVHWTLPAQTNVAIGAENGGCFAALVAGEGIPPQIVFLEESNDSWFSGQNFDPSALGVLGTALVFSEDAGASWVGGEDFRYTPNEAAPEQPEQCEAPEQETRLDWSPSPSGPLEVLSIAAGLDGCFEFSLQPVALGEDVEPVGASELWYLCVPEAAMPFVEGDYLSLSEPWTDAERELEVFRLDPLTLEPEIVEGQVALRASYLRGAREVDEIIDELGMAVNAVSLSSCPWLVEPGCATSERQLELAVAGQGFLAVGDPVIFDGIGEQATRRTAMLTYARERAVLDTWCSEGAKRLRYDIDIAVVTEPLL